MDVRVLLELWHGDADTTGYWQAGLAAAIAEKVEPMSDVSLINSIYDGLPVSELDPEAVEIIRAGWKLYLQRPKSKRGFRCKS